VRGAQARDATAKNEHPIRHYLGDRCVFDATLQEIAWDG